MNVFKKDNAGLFTQGLCKELCYIVKCKVANLTRVAKNALQVWTGGEIEPDQVANEMSIHHCIFAACILAYASFKFLASGCSIITIMNLEGRRKQVSDERIREFYHFEGGSPFEKVHRICLGLQPVAEFI